MFAKEKHYHLKSLIFKIINMEELKKEMIELEDGSFAPLSSLVSFTPFHKKEYDGDLSPFVFVRKGQPLRKIFSIVLKRATEDTYKLDVWNSTYGGHCKKLYTPKELFDAMKKYWGRMPNGGYYSHIPIAEYLAGRNISHTRDAISFENGKIFRKPYVLISFDNETESFSWLGHNVPKRAIRIFETDSEMEKWIESKLKK